MSNQSLQSKKMSQFKLPAQLQKYSFSQQMFVALQKLIKYDYDIVINLSSNELKELCQRELRRIQSTKANDNIEVNILVDCQLSIMVMMNQVRALLQMAAVNDQNAKKLGMFRKRLSNDPQESRENLVVKRYEGIASEIERYEEEISKFMESDVVNKEINIVSCYSFFRRLTKKVRKGTEKLICSYGYLLNALTYFLGEILKKYSPEIEPEQEDDETQLEQVNGEFGDLSYEQINKWKRMASRVIEQKLVQLSAICQQIPQLQTFNRNLQFSQLQNRQKIIILKIVDVIISLHHRVSYLSRNKPQLLRELQYVQEELSIINNTCSIFLQHVDMHSAHLRPIRFQGEVRKNNNMSEAFLMMRRQLMKMSEIIVNGQQYHNTNLKRMIEFVLLFVKAFTGHNDCLEEWYELVQQLTNSSESQYSEEEYEVIMQLQECMIEYHNKVSYMQQGDQQSNTKTNEQLQEEVNKLISDFERLKIENKQHIQNLDLLTRLRQQLEMEIEERDNMIYNLSTIKVTLEKKLLNQEGLSHNSSRAEEQLKKQQHQTQKYLQSSLLLREQLKVSENQREKLLEMIQRQKQKAIKLLETNNKFKSQKEALQIQNQELAQKLQKTKNDNIRQNSKLNKQINDLTNERDLLEMELKTAEANNSKLMERLESNEKKLLEYSKMNFYQEKEKQQRNQRQSRSQGQIQKLQGQIERHRKEIDKLRKQIENRRVQIEMVQRESNNYKQENYALKNKVKEIRATQEEIQERDETIRELKAKLDKASAKNNALLKENEQLREEQQQTSNKYKYAAKRAKEIQSKAMELQVNNAQLAIDLQSKNNQNIDLQKQLSSQSNQYNTEIKFYKDLSDKQGEDIRIKDERILHLQRKIEKLQQQLSQNKQKTQESNKELMDIKVRQFESTIQTHKLIEMKLEEQARALKTQLQQKIEVEFKLNLQIDKLSKQIEKLKDMLERYMRDITQKEFIIKKEREKYEEQVKIIRDYQIKQKIYHENQTPVRPEGKRNREEDTVDDRHDRQNSNNKKRQSQDPQEGSLSRSNVKYDMFYNAKEYERLLNQFNEYKAAMSMRVQEQQRSLNEARKGKIELEIKFNNSQLQMKRILNSKIINGASNQNNPANNHYNQTTNHDGSNIIELQGKKKLEALEQQYNIIINKYQVRVKDLSEIIGGLQQKVRKLQEENSLLYDRIKKQKEVSEFKIAELEHIISNLSKAPQQAQQKDKQRKEQENNLNNNQRQMTSSKDNQELKRKSQFLNDEINRLMQEKLRQESNKLQIIKQRDEMRRHYQDLKRHLSDQTKRANNLLGELQRCKEQLRGRDNLIIEINRCKKVIEQYQIQLQANRQQIKAEREKGRHEETNINIEYYLQRIRSLELALLAVGDQLSDAKEALSSKKNQQQGQFRQINSKQFQMLEDNKKLYSQNQYFNQVILQLKMQIQCFVRNESDWKSRQTVYLKDLQTLSRENLSLRENISKKQVVTEPPHNINPINTNYHDPNTDQAQLSINIEGIIQRMDLIIQGRIRWEGPRLVESLQRWRVPIIIHKEIQDLLNYVGQAVELIKIVRLQYIRLHNSGANNLIFANMLELVFRILAYFSEIETNSVEAKKIKDEIDEMTRKYSGGVFFTVLEEYTIHILQNNAIEEYKRELKEKAKELLEIKEKLDELITRQIEQEQRILSKPLTHRSRDNTPYKQSPTASPQH